MLVALAAVCESSCEATLFAGCFMETSVAVEGGGVLAALLLYTIGFTLDRPFIGQLDVSRQLHSLSSVATSSKIVLL